MERFFDPRGDDVEARDANVLTDAARGVHDGGPIALKTDEMMLRELKAMIRAGASSARPGPRSARQPVEGRGR